MVFKELEIQGFKSFPDKVKISFDTGVTGVVGPNGSGKSNLSDAVRWVLGETSSRQLRAAGKMEDVIFGGTRRRGAMGFAQVRLTLDNADHTFDVDADEVTIGRKYYRSGDSEYTINGQVCRLKDVYELLLDTGIGRDGYSVIGQGRIAEIVAAKSSERREIFEEACGIAKYRYRKTEAERRLAAAGENLERLRDILGELESRVGPLEKESAKAEKFLELAAQRKTLEVTLWTDGVHRAREAVRQQVRDYETAQADYERFDRETKAAEQEAEEIRMQAQQLTVAVERLNGDIRSITEQISGSESRIAVLEIPAGRNQRRGTGQHRGTGRLATPPGRGKDHGSGGRKAGGRDRSVERGDRTSDRCQQCQRCPQGYPESRTCRPDSPKRRWRRPLPKLPGKQPASACLPLSRACRKAPPSGTKQSRIWTTPSSIAGCWKKTRSSWRTSVPVWSSS